MCRVMEKHGWENGESERASMIQQLNNIQSTHFIENKIIMIFVIVR